MTAYSALETAIVALVVAACAYMAFGRVAPKLRARLLSALGGTLDRPGRAAWLRGLGRKLNRAAPAGGCDSGCGSCGTCEPSKPAVHAKPVQMPARK